MIRLKLLSVEDGFHWGISMSIRLMLSVKTSPVFSYPYEVILLSLHTSQVAYHAGANQSQFL